MPDEDLYPKYMRTRIMQEYGVWYDEDAVFSADDWQRLKERLDRLGISLHNQYPQRMVYSLPTAPVFKIATEDGWIEMPGTKSVEIDMISASTPAWEHLYWGAMWKVREDSERALRKIDAMLGYRPHREQAFVAGEDLQAGEAVEVGYDGWIRPARDGRGVTIGIARTGARSGEPVTVVTSPGGWH